MDLCRSNRTERVDELPCRIELTTDSVCVPEPRHRAVMTNPRVANKEYADIFSEFDEVMETPPRRQAPMATELASPPGASARTERQLEVMENAAASGTLDCTGLTIALVAPPGADLEAFGAHVVQRLHRAGTGIGRTGRVSVLPMSVLSMLPHMDDGNVAAIEPIRSNCVVYRNLNPTSVVPLEMEQRWLTVRKTSGMRGCVAVLHFTSMAAWRSFQIFASDVSSLVEHVIELGAPDNAAVTTSIVETLKTARINTWSVTDVTRLVGASDGALPQRGVALATLLTQQLIGFTRRTEQSNIQTVADQLGVILDRSSDPVSGFLGFDQVVQQMDGIVALAQRPDLRDGLGLHCAFVGAPGTGKTTAARALAWRLHRAGVTDRPHAHLVTRADLVGEYIGQTAPLVRAACQKARGGILFIDEAYSLADGGHADYDFYGREALSELVQQMEELRDELVVVLAGYPDQMANLIATNPGLSSRITNVVEFRSLTAPELGLVFDQFVCAKGLKIARKARSEVTTYLTRMAGDSAFGNSRGVRVLFAQTLTNWLHRTNGDSSQSMLIADLPPAVRALQGTEHIDDGGALQQPGGAGTFGYL